MAKPEITIAMTFYNGAATLHSAISSMLAQTFSNFQLLLCDDGSSDESLAIAHSFKDDRVLVLSDGKRKRLPARLNQCIDLARSPYLARMDADDISYPERLQRQFDFLSANPQVDLCGSAALVIDKESRPLWRFRPPTEHARIAGFPLLGFPIWHPAWMGKTEWFQRWRYNEQVHLSQDQELLFRSYKDSTFANLPDVLLGYRLETVRLKRMFRQKLFWVRYACGAKNGPQSLPAKAAFVGVQTLRFAMNCAAKVTGGTNWSRQFVSAATEEETKVWETLRSQFVRDTELDPRLYRAPYSAVDDHQSSTNPA
jgi:glycosyltransferase involved in cell wall biosynthesis